MVARTLESSPSILPLYARAAAPLIPGASLLPFVPGRGRGIPEMELSLVGERPDADAVAAYAKVCGFTLRDQLPPTYPHVLAFPLHMAVMADGRFPFGAVGLVHVENRVVQRRPIGIGEPLTIHVRPTQLKSHPRGRTFSLLTEIEVDGEKVWESASTMLRRGRSNGSAAAPTADGTQSRDIDHSEAHRREVELEATAEWKLGGDLGRRYGAVSGDRNPIHMHSLTAKPLGFPRAIAHGMWTKTRCLAALESRLPDAFAVDVRFRKPILLPGRVEFAASAENDQIHFAVRDPKHGTPHLEGQVEPLGDKPASPRRKTK
jgi:MaoC dehydratase-like protein